jgi:hypothetical protein
MIASSRCSRTLATVVAAMLLGGIAGCTRGGDQHEERSVEHTAATESDSGTRLKLGADAAARAGIRTAPAEAAAEESVAEAFGRTLDPLPFVQDLHAAAAARATATVAHAEYERVARLNQNEQNASTRDLQNARAALDKATFDLADATARLTLAWGAAAEKGDALVDDLVAGRTGLVRIDLPAGTSVPALPETVEVVEVAQPSRTHVARVLGHAPAVDPLVQGEGWLALVTADPPRPGTALAAHPPRDTARAGVLVPASAVVWVDAKPAVYAEPSTGEFERHPVALGSRRDDGWLVTAGLAPGERVVVAGAARLVSSEAFRAEPPHDD